MGGLKCFRACLLENKLADDPGTRVGPQELAPRLLELWAEVPPVVSLALRRLIIELFPWTVLYA